MDDMSQTVTTCLPLIFTYRDLIAGNKFQATVAVRGRALAHLDADDEIWIEGVQPGGMSGTGVSLQEAHADFRRGFTAILIEIASLSSDFASFEAEVHRFFYEKNEVAMQEWGASIDPARAEQLAAQFALDRIKPDTEPYVLVQQKHEERLTPCDNSVVNPEPALAA
ncbi:MAG: hypothetical protein M3541_22275 [Acidobacteriota bacterium]|nr:hypothetical protein [Acidobacteriota bacterium]MDQ3421462.1 hypothetical protein [Acidobacteriota bacterium]